MTISEIRLIQLLWLSGMFFQPMFGIHRLESELHSVVESIALSQNLTLQGPLPVVQKFDIFPEEPLECQSNSGLKTPKRSFHWYYEDLPISHSDPEFGHLKLKSKGKSLQFRPKFIKEAMAYIEYGGLYTCTLLHESPKKLEIFAMYEITLTSVIQHDEVVSISASSCKTLEEDKDSVTQSTVNCGYVTSSYVTSLVNYDDQVIRMADNDLEFELSNSTKNDFTFAIFGYSNAYFMLRNTDEESLHGYSGSQNNISKAEKGVFDSLVSFAKKWELETSKEILVGCGSLFILVVVISTAAIILWSKTKRNKNSLMESESWKNTQIIDKRDLVNQSSIGEGAFGTVLKAELRSHSSKPGKIVAVKELHQGVTDNCDILQEVKVLLKIAKHQNVLELVGFCLDSETKKPVAIVTEFCGKGSLSSFLQNEKNEVYLSSLVKIIQQVIEGMSHLERNKFVHRDLAARNVFLTSDDIVKIGDFGLTKDIQYMDYYKMTTGGLMPYKWMAPECILERKFSSKGDVWSFGVLIWEIFTFASDPYSDISSQDYCTAILSGYRLERPGNCPENFYEIVEACWTLDFEERPSFAILKKLFAKLSFKDTILKSEPLDLDSLDYLSYVNHGLVTTPAQASIGFFNQSYCRTASDQSSYRTSNGIYPTHRLRADSLLSNTSSLQDYQPKGYYNLSPTKFFNSSISEQITLVEDNNPTYLPNLETPVELEQPPTNSVGSFFFPANGVNDIIGRSTNQ